MKDYAAMSDREIAEKIGKSIGLGSIVGYLYMKNGVWTRFDPCNNPADAWPIMMANNIGIEKDFDFCCAECGSYYDTGLWIASAADRDLEVKHRSALRAAMIVFLMMKEGE